MYSPSLSFGYESRKCRYRILEYTHGIGLDLGCGHEKINPATAIGIDAGGNAANINIDLSKPDALKIFSDEYFDYVFSSHLLEDFYDTETALREWWRVIKPGGHLILYLPHKYFYPDFKDDPGVNPNHKHNFICSFVYSVGIFF